MKVQIISVLLLLSLSACGGDDKASPARTAEKSVESTPAVVESKAEPVMEVVKEATSVIDGEVVKTPDANAEASEGMMDEAMDMGKEAAMDYIAENQDDLMKKAKDMAKEKAADMMK